MRQSAAFLTLLVLAQVTTGCIAVSKDAYQRDIDGLRQQADWLEAQKRGLDEQAQQWQQKQQSASDNASRCQREKAALETELKSCKEKLTALAKNCGKAGALLSQCEEELASTRAELSVLRDKYVKLEARLAAVQKRLDALRESIASVRRRLAAMIAGGKLKVVVKDGFLVIQLQSDILFDTGKSKLKDAARPVLKELGEVLKKFKGRRFQVAGHTDPRGDDHLNWKLSTARALSVVEFLIRGAKVPAQMLSAGGYASYLPVADNATEEGMRANRRVEFLLLPDLSELLELAGLKSD